jgi:hypothetical protein
MRGEVSVRRLRWQAYRLAYALRSRRREFTLRYAVVRFAYVWAITMIVCYGYVALALAGKPIEN